MSANDGASNNLDVIFTEIGEFGLFQIVSLILICIPSLLSASYVVNYIFTANTLDYRCKVPNCDSDVNNGELNYAQPWLKYAIPSTDTGFENCAYYAPNISFTTAESPQCSRHYFNTSKQIQCNEFVYKTDETNIQTEFNIHCADSYKLALIGSANCLGRLIFLPLTGMLSDKFGRLRIVVLGMWMNSIFGLIKSFSMNYGMYISFEFLEGAAGTCTFSGIYVLAMEWISSKYRPLGTTLVVTSFPLGEMMLGIVAMNVHNFRHLLRVLYTPGLLVIFWLFLVPESPRWLLISGRVDHAIKVLKRIAWFNGRNLSDKSIDLLRTQYTPDEQYNDDGSTKDESLSILQQLHLIIQSRKLSLRLLNNCYQWVTCCFCYYGLSLISTHIPGNRYISFIIVQAVEIPGALLPGLLLSRFGRRNLMFSALTLLGCAVMITPWIPATKSMIILMLFMIGKASATFAFNILYIYTAELWPTNLRTTIMNSCSMTGRVGATIAPLTALLMAKTPFLPFLLFGSTAILAAATILLCPDTFKTKLPDSVEEAKDL